MNEPSSNGVTAFTRIRVADGYAQTSTYVDCESQQLHHITGYGQWKTSQTFSENHMPSKMYKGERAIYTYTMPDKKCYPSKQLSYLARDRWASQVTSIYLLQILQIGTNKTKVQRRHTKQQEQCTLIIPLQSNLTIVLCLTFNELWNKVIPASTF